MSIENVFESAYTVLVELGGASPGAREDFVRFHVKRHSPDSPECAFTTEYRFGGELGMGGKFWVDLDGFRVSLYSEDATEEREQKRAALNKRLRPYFLRWHRLCAGGGVELTEEQRAEELEKGLLCDEWPACEAMATYFDEGDFAWCDAHGSKNNK